MSGETIFIPCENITTQLNKIKISKERLQKKRASTRKYYEKNKTTKKFTCEHCNYSAPHFSALAVHKTRIKHKLRLEIQEERTKNTQVKDESSPEV